MPVINHEFQLENTELTKPIGNILGNRSNHKCLGSLPCILIELVRADTMAANHIFLLT